MQVINLFSNEESIEQHIRDLLTAEGDIPIGYIDDYISSIFAYSSFEDYVGITDEAILNDWSEWMDEDGEWKAK
jgi:hypothetical protein